MRHWLLILVTMLGVGTAGMARADETFSTFLLGQPLATSPLAASDLLPVVQNGVTKQIYLSGLLNIPGSAGRLLASANGQTLNWLATIPNGVLVTDGSGNPSISTTLPLGLVTGIVNISQGGTNTGTQVTNGISFYDGTKVTSGSGLTWDGTSFGVGTAATGLGPLAVLNDMNGATQAAGQAACGKFMTNAQAGTPAVNNAVCAVIGIYGGNNRQHLWGADILALQLGPAVTTTGSTHTNTTVDSMGTTVGLSAGMRVVGYSVDGRGTGGVPTGTTIASVNSSTAITLNQATTSSLVGTTLYFVSAGAPDGIVRTAEIEVNNIMGFNADPFSGSAPYRKNGVEIIGHNSSLFRPTNAMMVWANDTTGRGWFENGITLSSIGTAGLVAVKNPAGRVDTGTAFSTAFIYDQSDSAAVLKVSGSHVSIIDSAGFVVSGAGAITATLPASAGGGGVYVCVDTAGVFYKKAACP